jgi:hypothetical protein
VHEPPGEDHEDPDQEQWKADGHNEQQRPEAGVVARRSLEESFIAALLSCRVDARCPT